MTEAEWLACDDPRALLQFLQDRASGRKLRLFACAAFRRDGTALKSQEDYRAWSVAESHADGTADPGEMERLREEYAWWSHWANPFEMADYGPDVLEPDPLQAARGWNGLGADKLQAVYLLREVFGNPFRPAVLDPSWLAWRDGAVRKMAQSIYDERRFTDLPILADALEDAGCTHAAVLAHCREPGEHVRGCWVVDLLLGKV